MKELKSGCGWGGMTDEHRVSDEPRQWGGLHHIVSGLNATELYPSKWLFLYYVHFIITIASWCALFLNLWSSCHSRLFGMERVGPCSYASWLVGLPGVQAEGRAGPLASG